MLTRHPSIPPTHPGALLREIVLPETGLTKVALAEALGVSRQTLYDVLNQKQPVTANLAVRLGKLLGNGAQFWMNMQRNYDLAIAEREVDVTDIPTLMAD